jgi:hypothetical protein
MMPPLESLSESELDATANLEGEPGKGPEVHLGLGFVSIIPRLPSADSWFEFHLPPLLARCHPLVVYMRDLKVLLENLEQQIGLVA